MKRIFLSDIPLKSKKTKVSTPHEPQMSYSAPDNTNSSFLCRLPPPSSIFTSSNLPEASKTQLVGFYLSHGRDSRNRTVDEILNYPDERLEALHDYIQWLFPLPEGSPFNIWAPVVEEVDAVTFRRCKELRAALRRSFSRMLGFYGFEMRLVEETRIISDARPTKQTMSRDEEEGSEAVFQKLKDEPSEPTSSSTEGTNNENTQAKGKMDVGKPLKADSLEETTVVDTPQSKRLIIAPLPSPLFDKAARNWWCRFDHNHLRITRIIRSLRVLGLESEAGAFHQALLQAKKLYVGGPGARSYEFWERAAMRPLEMAPEDGD